MAGITFKPDPSLTSRPLWLVIQSVIAQPLVQDLLTAQHMAWFVASVGLVVAGVLARWYAALPPVSILKAVI